jgi:hypothetical protein
MALATLIFAILTTVIAGATLYFGYRAVQSANEALKPMTDMAAQMGALKLMESSARVTSALTDVANRLANIGQVPQTILAQQRAPDEDAVGRAFENERNRLAISLATIPKVPLPRCRELAETPDYFRALEIYEEATVEARVELTKALSRLDAAAERVASE